MLREKFKVSYVQISLQKRSWPFKKIVNCCLFLEACPGTLSLICSWSIKAKMFIELHSRQCIPTDKTLRISFFRFLEQWDHQWLEMRLLAPLIMVSLKRFKTEWRKTIIVISDLAEYTADSIRGNSQLLLQVLPIASFTDVSGVRLQKCLKEERQVSFFQFVLNI